MVQPIYRPFEQIQRKLREGRQHAENSARLAYAFGTVETVGWGEFTIQDRIDFELAFTERPAVLGMGTSFTEDSIDDLRATRYPRAQGEVLRWDVDVQGLYRGCWVIVVVEDRSSLIEPTDPDPDPNYSLVHDFTFLGVALKPMDTAQKKGDVRDV